jgi:hypothetical protein
VDQIFEVSKEKINPNALDLRKWISTNKIDGLRKKKQMLPTLIEHVVQKVVEGFFQWNAYLDGACN